MARPARHSIEPGRDPTSGRCMTDLLNLLKPSPSRSPVNRASARHPEDFRVIVEDMFKTVTLWLAVGTEAAAALIIGLAVLEAAVGALWLFVLGVARRSEGDPLSDRKEEVRPQLGRWLSVALEFELAAIVVLRTVLNYFLQQEIDKAQRRGSSWPAAQVGNQ